MTLVDTIVTLYSFTEADTAALEATLYEQLRLSYLERLRTLAIQHGVQNPTVTVGAAEDARLREKARVDAQSITDTYNADLRRQVEAIYARNPLADRAEYVRVLNSWGRNRTEYKAIQIGIATVMWAAQFGIELFISRNNLQNQLFKALHAPPRCPDCMFIVRAGIVTYRFVQENPLPAHPNCTGEWAVIEASDLTERGTIVWLGDYQPIRAA